MKKIKGFSIHILCLMGVIIMVSSGCSEEPVQTPVLTPGKLHTEPFGDVNSIAAGSYYSVALREDGTLWEWGKDYNSPWLAASGLEQLITSDMPLAPDAVLLQRLFQTHPGLTQFLEGIEYSNIAMGERHTLLLTNDGTVYSYGQNSYGQLGDGTFTNRPDAPFVNVGSGYVAIAAGGNYSFGIKSDGTLWAWGGDADGDPQTLPYQIGEHFVRMIASSGMYFGGCHLIAEKNDGRLFEWGLSDGVTIQTAQPNVNSGNFKMFAAGQLHSLALKDDGTLWAWGDNSFGQLGTGTVFPSRQPVQIGTGYKAIAAGASHSIAVADDGTLMSWGSNSFGQLGDGTKIDRYSPVQVRY